MASNDMGSSTSIQKTGSALVALSEVPRLVAPGQFTFSQFNALKNNRGTHILSNSSIINLRQTQKVPGWRMEAESPNWSNSWRPVYGTGLLQRRTFGIDTMIYYK